MIQRIQSILLLLSGLGFLGQFATDFATSTQPLPQLLADQRFEIQDSPLLLILVIAGFLFSVAAVFLYQNRVLQMRITLLSLVSGILLPLLAYFLMYKEGSPIPAGVTVDDALGAYLPIVSIISSAVAIRFIKKDDQLVKSMDRLR
jgi:hypothetical protein